MWDKWKVQTFRPGFPQTNCHESLSRSWPRRTAREPPSYFFCILLAWNVKIRVKLCQILSLLSIGKIKTKVYSKGQKIQGPWQQISASPCGCCRSIATFRGDDLHLDNSGSKISLAGVYSTSSRQQPQLLQWLRQGLVGQVWGLSDPDLRQWKYLPSWFVAGFEQSLGHSSKLRTTLSPKY